MSMLVMITFSMEEVGLHCVSSFRPVLSRLSVLVLFRAVHHLLDLPSHCTQCHSVRVQLHQAAAPAQDAANGPADPTAATDADASMSRPASDADDADEEGSEEYLPFIVKRSHNLAGPLFNKVRQVWNPCLASVLHVFIDVAPALGVVPHARPP